MTHVSDGPDYYRVWYDLRGDHVYTLVIFYREDGSIDEIMSSGGGS